MQMLRFNTYCTLLVLLVGCGKNMAAGTSDSGLENFRGLLASPRLLAFTCVTPGCNTTLKVRIISTVTRRVAIKRVVLSAENSDFTLSADEKAPFILGAASEFSVDVTFKPTHAPMNQVNNLLVTYTDASATEGPERIEAGELVIPLIQRLVGEPILGANPGALDFGVVDIGNSKTLSVTARNDGFGNLSLVVDRADSGMGSTVTIALPANAALVPDASVQIPVTFSPLREEYIKGELELGSSTPNITPVRVQIQGTSHQWPKVAIEPEENLIDFGEVPKGQKRKITVQLVNFGGRPLNMTNLSVVDVSTNLKAQFPLGMTSAQLPPLTRLPIEIELSGTVASIVDGRLKATTNDPQRGTLEVPIRGIVTEPKIAVSPVSHAWGTVPMGWVVNKRIEVKNVGFGKLKIKSIGFVGGTSMLYTFKSLPALPIELDRDRILAFEVEFRAETGAAFMGAVSVESTDVATPFAEVALSATGGSCTAGCPIANGTPSCAMGKCSVGACSAGFYDTNGQSSDGCECKEIGTDPGLSCASGVNKGVLPDNGSSSQFTGLLHSGDDIDYVRFYAQDDGQVFGDNYNVRINLSTSDPNIQMCVYRYETGTATNDCFEQNEACGRNYGHGGAFLRNDGAVYSIKVFRTANTAGTCTPYTVYMSNG
jgi:hypothetical protein